MKRLLMMVPIAALAVTGFVPAQAADPPEKTPIVVTCKGTGGYAETSDGPRWSYESDMAHNPVLGGSDSIGCLPVVSPDTTDPANWPVHDSPAGILAHVQLDNGQGSFACGNGTLDGNDSTITYVQGVSTVTVWDVEDWSASLSDGVGAISGTASRNGEVRDLSGTIVVDDGAATGNCDDSAGNSDVFVSLVLE